MTRVAFIGGGWIATSIAVGLRSYGGELCAVADVSERRRAQWRSSAGVAVFDDHRTMLDATRPDVVFVLTPTAFHAVHTADALDAGADVVVEKPIASTIGEAQEMIGRAARLGRTLLVDESYVTMPSHLVALGALEAGRIGAVRSVLLTFFGWRPRPEYEQGVAAANAGWRSDGEFAWISDHFVHLVALSRLFAGRSGVDGVTALGGPTEAEVRGATWRCGDVDVVWLRASRGEEEVFGTASGLHTTVVGTNGLMTVLGEGGSWGDGRGGEAVRFGDGSTLDAVSDPDALWVADVGYYPAAHITSVATALDALQGLRDGYTGSDALVDLMATQALIESARESVADHLTRTSRIRAREEVGRARSARSPSCPRASNSGTSRVRSDIGCGARRLPRSCDGSRRARR